MKETPILFSTPMVQAILNGTKTQTRRVVTQRNSTCMEKLTDLNFKDAIIDSFFEPAYLKVAHKTDCTRMRVWCKYELGTMLWVRENFYKHDKNPGQYNYKADYVNPEEFKGTGWKCKPSIHLPKTAARLWLQITGIRVERLQDITEADAKAEGVEWTARQGYKNYVATDEADVSKYARISFASLWWSINGTDSWDANPWVWVIEFKVISKTGKP